MALPWVKIGECMVFLIKRYGWVTLLSASLGCAVACALHQIGMDGTSVALGSIALGLIPLFTCAYVEQKREVAAKRESDEAVVAESRENEKARLHLKLSYLRQAPDEHLAILRQMIENNVDVCVVPLDSRRGSLFKQAERLADMQILDRVVPFQRRQTEYTYRENKDYTMLKMERFAEFPEALIAAMYYADDRDEFGQLGKSF